MRRLLAIGLLLCAACADDPHPIESISWDQRSGPCPQGMICNETITVRADCTATYFGPGGTTEGVADTAACAEVLRLASRYDLYAFMGRPNDCVPMVTDRADFMMVKYETEEQLMREVTGCQQPTLLRLMDLLVEIRVAIGSASVAADAGPAIDAAPLPDAP